MRKLLLLATSALLLVGLVPTPAWAVTYQSQVRFHYVLDSVDWDNKPLVSGGTTPTMSTYGDVVDQGSWLDFQTDTSPNLAATYADVQSGSTNGTAFTLNAAADQAVSLSVIVTNVVPAAETHDGTWADQSQNVAQVGRSGSGGTDSSCDGPGAPNKTCYGQVKLQLTDPDQNDWTQYFQCVFRGGTTQETDPLFVTGTSTVLANTRYKVACVKYADDAEGGTYGELLVWRDYEDCADDGDWYDCQLTATGAWTSSYYDLGPVRTKLFLSAGNKWQSPSADDQYEGGVEEMWVCVGTNGISANIPNNPPSWTPGCAEMPAL